MLLDVTFSASNNCLLSGSFCECTQLEFLNYSVTIEPDKPSLIKSVCEVKLDLSRFLLETTHESQHEVSLLE